MSRLPWLAAVAALIAGCAPATRVVLLPQDGAAAGAVMVTPRQPDTQQPSAVLDAPYEQAEVRPRTGVETAQSDARAVQQRYGTLLAVQPAAAARFTLFFLPGTSQLSPESSAELAEVLSQAMARPGGEIVVVGHTDRVGTLESNDALSLQRARAIRELLIGRGFDASRVDAVGRGEREPVVPTADEVAEPKNRRAEILVR